MASQTQPADGNQFGVRWQLAAAGGGLVLLLGLVLLFFPVGSQGGFAQTTGLFLVAAGSIELFVGVKSTPSAEGRITILLSAITLAAALLVLLRPDAYPLFFIAVICLSIRGIGALIAAFIGIDGFQPWVLARGIVDAALAALLVAGAPMAAIISLLSGRRWPLSEQAVLGNFIALSMIAAGTCLLGLALARRRNPAAAAGDESERG